MRTRTQRRITKRGHRKARRPAGPPAVEVYTDERVAEFILSNTVDAVDYARAIRLVRKMGLDPARIDHDKPVGVP